MAEPRARIRQKGQTFHAADLQELLLAFGDNTYLTPSSTAPPTSTNPGSLPQTLTTLDEILTDFVIETCHAAALSASYSRRQKIKVDDFKFVLRKDGRLLGRVLEQMWKDREMKESRKVLDFEKEGREGVGELEGIAEMAGGVGAERERGEGGSTRGRRRGGGAGGVGKRKRKGGAGDEEDEEGGRVRKRRES